MNGLSWLTAPSFSAKVGPNMETNTWDLPDVSYGRLEVHSLNMSCEILLGCSDQTFLAETRTASLSSLMMLRDSCKSFQNDRVFF